MSGGNGTGNGAGLVLVVNTLSGEESGTTLRGLQDDGALLVAGSLERGNDGGGRGDVDGGDGIAVLLCVLEELQDIITSDDTSLAGENAARPGQLSPLMRLRENCAGIVAPRERRRAGQWTYSWAPIVIVFVVEVGIVVTGRCGSGVGGMSVKRGTSEHWGQKI